MSTLTQEHKDVMGLYLRSKRDADGWAKVSRMVWPLVKDLDTKLFEVRPEGDGGFMRLTAEGQTLATWTL